MMRHHALWVVGVACAVAALAPTAACGPACRTVATRPIDVPCDLFRGEIHVDDADTFRSFLQDQCFAAPNADAVDALVESVDFTRDALFVASGPRDEGVGRCVRKRALDETSVCEDGLHVAFRDTIVDDPSCGGIWTLSFAMPRDDMRAAVAADDDFAD